MKLRNILFAIAALFAIGPLTAHADDGLRLVSFTLARVQSLLGSGSTAATNLGLGTAATANTGTSGATVPLLSASNTFGNSQTIAGNFISLTLSDTAASQNAGGLIRLTGQGNGAFCLQSNTSTGTPFSTVSQPYCLSPNGGFQVGGTGAVASSGELALSKITASATAPGAASLKLEAVAGTNTGTCKIIAYAGTSTTSVTIVDNVGSGC